MVEWTSFGRFIAMRRKYYHMTQEELAEKIGVSKSAVAKWETNGGLPDRDNLRCLSEALSVSVDDLHKIIRREDLNIADIDANITSDVIAALESYGYKVIRQTDVKTGEGDENNGDSFQFG